MNTDILNENLRLKNRIEELETKLKDSNISASFLNNISVFIDCIYAPVFIKDKHGVFLSCNYAYEDFMGFGRSEIIGKNAFDVFERKTAEEIAREDTAVLESNTVIIKEKEIKNKTGETKKVRITKNCLPVKGSGIVAIIGIIKDITRQKDFEKSLFDITAKLNKSQEAGKIGSWELDVQTNRIWASDAAFSILFLNKTTSFIGVDYFLKNVISEEHRVRFYKAVEVLKKTQNELHVSFPVYESASGKTSYLNIVGECVISSDGTCKKISGIVQDITNRKNEEIERELLIKKLEAALCKAKETTKVKEEFLAMMSHEIRTPLTGIIGFSQLLKKNIPESFFEDNGKHKNYVDSIINAAKRLNELLSNLLALSEYEANPEVLVELYEFDIRDVVSGIFELYENKILEKSLDFNINIEGDGIVFSDRIRLEHILLNIIGNAIKFTEEGCISVSSKTDKHFYIISVSDTGIGIAREKHSDIFDSFRQVNPGVDKRKYQGVGLGLAICRKFIKSLGGKITVESTSGKGSIFTIYIPVKSN
jgi:PAS domain S-box-containing protein